MLYQGWHPLATTVVLVYEGLDFFSIVKISAIVFFIVKISAIFFIVEISVERKSLGSRWEDLGDELGDKKIEKIGEKKSFLTVKRKSLGKFREKSGVTRI